jgi:DNA-binding transcriptional LysR family regulator
MGYDYFASPSYLEKHGTPKVPEDIFEHRCIYRLTNESDLISWRFGDQELAIKPGIICDSPYMTNALTIRGTGISQLPLILAGDSVARGDLVQLFDGEYAFRLNIYGIYGSRNYLPHKVKVLIEDIKKDLPGEIQELEASVKKQGTVDKGPVSPSRA